MSAFFMGERILFGLMRPSTRNFTTIFTRNHATVPERGRVPLPPLYSITMIDGQTPPWVLCTLTKIAL